MNFQIKYIFGSIRKARQDSKGTSSEQGMQCDDLYNGVSISPRIRNNSSERNYSEIGQEKLTLVRGMQFSLNP